jgi:hypothetical protein
LRCSGKKPKVFSKRLLRTPAPIRKYPLTEAEHTATGRGKRRKALEANKKLERDWLVSPLGNVATLVGFVSNAL